MIVQNTPVETCYIRGIEVLIKREDMACKLPGPPSAKMRGLDEYFKRVKRQGCKTVGYMDTAISMAGWGVAYFAQLRGLNAHLYYPQYKSGYKFNQAEYIAKWKEFGATVIPLENPHQHQINILRAKRHFIENTNNGLWLPNGLKFEETRKCVYEEYVRSFKDREVGTLVISVGSGMMLAGVLRGLRMCNHKLKVVYGVLVHNQTDPIKKFDEVCELSSLHRDSVFPELNINTYVDGIKLIPYKYEYHEPSTKASPFPCNDYYDRKAWEWLLENVEQLPQPILFWNIGA